MTAPDDPSTARDISGFKAEPILVPPMENSFVVGIATARVLGPEAAAAVWNELAVSGSSADLDRVLVEAIGSANSNYFHFELAALHEATGPRLLHHLDRGMLADAGLSREASTRKLTILLPLVAEVDTVLPVVEFPEVERSQQLAVVTALMFPSFLRAAAGAAAEFGAVLSFALGDAFR